MSLAGTSYFPYLEKNILLLEDVDEKTYHIERLLTQLEQQSDSENILAVIFGSFNNCPLNHPQKTRILNPALMNLPQDTKKFQ